MALARFRSPRARARRMKVDETCSWSRAGLPVKPIRPRPRTSKPILEPMSRRSATLPKRW